MCLPCIYDILRSRNHKHKIKGALADCSIINRASIKAVYRIENFALWRKYTLRVRSLQEDHARLGVQAKEVKFKSGDATLSLPWVISALDMGSSLQSAANEHLLLHGTSWDKADSIVRSGFDFRRCDRGMYGDGVYFSPAASLMT